MTQSTKKNNSLAWAHPLVRDWFITKFGAPTEPQEQGWPAINAGQTTLISAPTGSGKTFAAFLACIDELVRRALTNELIHETEVVYISPLKALSNDIQKNLLGPLSEISKLAKQRGLAMMDIEVAVRTGDTLARERLAMLKKPPHILVTTPESLYILLTAEKSRVMLKTVKTVIVDEIHALANDKRGTHLALSLERLEALTNKPPIRIGLSATQKPIEVIAHFLTGNERPSPVIINIGHRREIEVSVEIPNSELGPIASNEMWDEMYDRIASLAEQNRSTLVFVNTRRLAERIAHHLTERLGEDKVAAHHGSLSRKLRLAAETKLKQGELKVLVATASLELGIDIGAIDLVCQIGSPRAIATALQRIGRAGHWHGAVAKGRLFATTCNELLECAALVYAIREGDLDALILPQEPLDILSQQIIATCATGDWQEDAFFAMIKKAYPYAQLSKATFNAILEMLAEGMAGSRGRYGTYLLRDKVNGIVKGRRGSRLAAITSGGAIPENGLFTVIAEPHGMMVGTLDEDFAVESNRGDIILLGTTSWRIKRIESSAGRVRVENAHGAPPSVPFWRGEAPARTKELSLQVSRLREKLSELAPPFTDHQTNAELAAPIQWLKEHCGLSESAALQLIEYIQKGKAVLSAVPTQKTIIAERFFDESGGMQLIIHAPLGARINKAWGLALRKRFCRSFNFELQAAATDDGLNIALAEQHSFPLSDVFQFLHPHTIKEVLIQAVLQSPLFPTRWRWSASRSLALLRFRHGRKIPPNIQRMLSDDLLAAVFPDAAACQDNLGGRDIELPDHPLIQEAMKEILNEALDVEGLTQVLQGILAGQIQCLAVDTPIPSTFSHEILNANPYAYLDDAPLEERRARAVEMRRVLPDNIAENMGRLDPLAIQEVQLQAWPDIRNADELHDFLQTVTVFPENLVALPHITPVDWQSFFDELVAAGRITRATVGNQHFWMAAEKDKTFLAVHPHALLSVSLKEIELTVPERGVAITNVLRGWMLHLGPITSAELARLILIEETEIEQALVGLETTGFILRGQFRPSVSALEWCERRLLARIHRLTVGRLRKEIAPVTAAQFVQWLLRWQHLAAGTQLQGERGLLEVIQQLQGFELPANAWETQILAKRVSDYDKEMLDRLCLSGAVGWGRFSPHPATRVEDEELVKSKGKKRRVIPTSVVPITFFIREHSDWMPVSKREEHMTGLSHVAKNVFQFLSKRGASFFTEIVKGVDKLKSEVEFALWELVAAGLITADGFDNLRALIDPRRRLNKGRRHKRPLFSMGRWSLLHTDHHPGSTQQLEAMAWVLLNRYGVVFRDLLAREKNIPPWRELLRIFRRLEDRGEIRGGRFVEGFLGEQFALPYAVDSLRVLRKQPTQAGQINIAAVDPLNLIGIILPGPRVSAFSGKKVTLL